MFDNNPPQPPLGTQEAKVKFPIRIEKTIKVPQKEYSTVVSTELRNLSFQDGEQAYPHPRIPTLINC